MTEKEKAIKEFAKAMRTAHIPYIAENGRMTPAMDMAWNSYVIACMKEVKDVRSKERHNDQH